MVVHLSTWRRYGTKSVLQKELQGALVHCSLWRARAPLAGFAHPKTNNMSLPKPVMVCRARACQFHRFGALLVGVGGVGYDEYARPFLGTMAHMGCSTPPCRVTLAST